MVQQTFPIILGPFLYTYERCEEMLKGEDSATWERLKNDPEQETLEQEIEEIQCHGHLPGLTHDEEAVNRFITVVAPYLSQYVENILVPKFNLNQEQPEVYHQLKGNIALRCALNSTRIKDTLITFCKGNPFASENTKL